MIEVLLGIVIELFTGLTGYAVMYVFSLGRIRPKIEDDWLATIVGLAFWAIVIVGLCFWFRE